MHEEDKGFPTDSTYKAPITVVDEDGNPVDLTSADITYKVTEDRSGKDVHYTASDADSAITIDSNNSNVVIVNIPADEVDWVGEVYEQLRVDLGEPNSIVLHRLVYFYDVSIDSITDWIESFGDGNTSEYIDPNDILSAQDNTVYEGSYSGKIDNQSGSQANAISYSGLRNYPERGDKFETYIVSENTQTVYTIFGGLDSENFYFTGINSDGDCILAKLSSGSITQIDSISSANYNYDGNFARFEIDFDSQDNGDIIVDINNGDKQLSGNDIEHNGRAFGWGSQDGAIGYVDSAKLI